MLECVNCPAQEVDQAANILVPSKCLRVHRPLAWQVSKDSHKLQRCDALAELLEAISAAELEQRKNLNIEAIGNSCEFAPSVSLRAEPPTWTSANKAKGLSIGQR